MLQAGSELYLSPEPVDADRRRHFRRQHFNNDFAAERRLFSDEDARHSATAELMLESIAVAERGLQLFAQLFHPPAGALRKCAANLGANQRLSHEVVECVRTNNRSVGRHAPENARRCALLAALTHDFPPLTVTGMDVQWPSSTFVRAAPACFQESESPISAPSARVFP